MKQLKDKKTVQKLLKAAISHLCRVSVGLEGNFVIDGIICIAHGESDEQEVVVKIHEKVEDKEILVTTPEHNVNAGNKKQSSNVTIQSDEAAQSISYVDNVISTKGMNSFCKVMRDHHNDHANVTRGKQLLEIEDDDVEFLGISEAKQLLGDLDNFSDIECTGYDLDDVSFSDVVIKPDPGNIGKSLMSYGASNIDEESSDEELKIEQLKAGRVRKPHKGAYRDVHGAPVQLLSTEEFKRILKSEKLKRSRDKSPDFVSAPKMLKTGHESFSAMQVRQQIPQSHSVSVQSQVQVPKTVVGSLSYLTNAVKTSSFSHPISHKTSIVKNTNTSHENKNKEGTTIQRSPSFVSHIQRPEHTRPKAVKNFIQQTSGKTQIMSSASVSVNTGRITDSTSTNNNLSHSHSVLNALSGVNSYNDVPTIERYSLIPQSVLRQTESPLGVNSHEKINTQQNVAKSEPGSSPSGGVICLDTCNEATKSDVHKCPVCSEVFESFRFLDLHMYRHHPGMFLCPLCGKSFKQRSTRNRHIVALHSSEKNFVCSMCNVSFTRADTLKKHISVSHPGVDIPKTTFSYSKGVELPSAVQTVQQQHLQDYTSDAAAVNDNVYGEGVITPIQVTAAAIENTTLPFTSSDPSSFIAVQPGNITNITPIHPNMGAENLILTHNITPNLTPEVSKDSFLTAENIIVPQQQQNEPVTRNVVNVETISTSGTVPKAPEDVITSFEINVSGVSNISSVHSSKPLATLSASEMTCSRNDHSLVTMSTSEITHHNYKPSLISSGAVEITDNSTVNNLSLITPSASGNRLNPLFATSNSEIAHNSINHSLVTISTSSTGNRTGNNVSLVTLSSHQVSCISNNPSLITISSSELIAGNSNNTPSLATTITSGNSRSGHNLSEVIDNCSKENLIKSNVIHTVQPLNMSHKYHNINSVSSAIFTDRVCDTTKNSMPNLGVHMGTQVSTVINHPANNSVSIESIKPISSTTIEKLNSHENKASKLNPHESHASQLDRSESQASQLNSHESQESQLNPHENEASNLNPNKSQASQLNTHESQESQLNPQENDASNLNPNKSQASQLNPHSSQASQIYSRGLDLENENVNTIVGSTDLNVASEVFVEGTEDAQVDKSDNQNVAHLYESTVTDSIFVSDMCNTIEISDEDTNDQLQHCSAVTEN